MRLKYLTLFLILTIILTASSVNAVKFYCQNLGDGTFECNLPLGNIENKIKRILKVLRSKISFFGTEYTVNDIQGKVFLQLLNETNQPLSDSSCFVSIFKPDNTVWINNSPMTNLEQDGLYYKIFNVPEITGVYMVSAYCYIPNQAYNLTMNETQTEDWESGDFQGGTGWSESSWTKTNGVSMSTISPHSGIYNVKMRYSNRYFYRGFNMEGDDLNVSFWARCRDWNNESEEVYAQLWDGDYKTFYTFNNNCNDDTYHYYTFLLTSDNYKLGTNILRFLTSGLGSGDYFFVDDIILRTGSRTYYFGAEVEEYQEIRGSGEIHVQNPPEDIWTYDNRTSSPDEYKLIFIGGTEYSSGEEGIASVQFLRTVAGNPKPINDGECSVKIFYPNSSVFIDNSTNNSIYLPDSNAIYRTNFTVPNTTGIYNLDFFCSKKGIKTYISGSFHVSEWANSILKINRSLPKINKSIWDKLYKIQDELNNITLTIYSVNESIIFEIKKANETIMNKLYLIQDEIASVNETLIYYLMNITNITANITIAQEELLDILVALWGDKIARPEIYTAGFTGFLPSVSAQPDDAQFVCIDNQTLQSTKKIKLNASGVIKLYDRTIEIPCTYGCVNNTCVMPDITIYIILFIVIIVVYILYRHFFS